MKIKDVIINEDQPAPAPPASPKKPNMNYKGSAGAQAIAQQNPGIKNVNQIQAGQVIKLPNGQQYKVAKGDTLDAIAAGKFKGTPPGGSAAPAPEAPAPEAPAPEAPAPAAPEPESQADPSIDPYDPSKDPSLAAGNAELAKPAPAENPDLDRLKQLAIGQNTMNQQASKQGAAMAQAANPTPAPNVNALGVAQTANVPGLAGTPPAGQGGKPTPGPADAAPAAARGEPTSPNVNPDTGLDATPKKVAGSSNLTTGSDDEMAWRAKNPNWNMTNKQYPGPGQWDPQTGRSKKEIEQGKQNLDAVKGFFNKINPFASKPQDAGPAGNVNNQSSGYNQPQKESSELAMLRKLSGLK
jgi:hypothetical protein